MRESFHDIAVALEYAQHEPNAYARVKEMVNVFGLGKARLFFVGNGGSAAIASHMATDWLKNGEFPTFCFNDGSQLTCITNDIGFESVFWTPIELHGQIGDVLFAISSSGQSKNIISAVEAARSRRMNVVTLSGFRPDNPLRQMGQVNFYVPSNSYGTVEISHLAILHSILDEVMFDRDREDQSED